MKIIKPLNNNVVMGYDKKQGEVVVVGTGIGFHAKKGDMIDTAKIQKIFTVSKNQKLTQLIEEIPASYLELTEQLFEYAKNKYNIQLNDDIYLLLTDHIYYALKRIADNVELDNPFLPDIKQFYPKEYAIALYARKLIVELYNITIPDSEVGYISMHMIASEYQQDRRLLNKTFDVINVSIAYISENYLKDISETSLSYTRLVNHVKFFAQRYLEDKESDNNDTLLNEAMKELFSQEYLCIDDLAKILYQQFGKVVTESEKNYLVLHLRNCKNLKQ